MTYNEELDAVNISFIEKLLEIDEKIVDHIPEDKYEAIFTQMIDPDSFVENQLKAWKSLGLTAENLRNSLKSFKQIYEDYKVEKGLGLSDKYNNFMIHLTSFIDNILKEVVDSYDEYEEVVCYIQKIDDNAKIPMVQHEDDACMDIYAIEDQTIEPHSYGVFVRTGFRLALPEGTKANIYARSGLSLKTTLRLSNGVGIIDSNYRDEVKVIFDNIGNEPYTIHTGDRIAQMELALIFSVPMKIGDVVNMTTDRKGGFGSTGK